MKKVKTMAAQNTNVMKKTKTKAQRSTEWGKAKTMSYEDHIELLEKAKATVHKAKAKMKTTKKPAGLTSEQLGRQQRKAMDNAIVNLTNMAKSQMIAIKCARKATNNKLKLHNRNKSRQTC